MQAPPAAAGIALADWNWKVVREFVAQRFEVWLSRSSCLNYLHRFGFVAKRPMKRLLKADPAKRAAFVREYAALRDEAAVSGAKLFFADEAHFSADADLRGKWVLNGEPALVDTTSRRWGEKASYYSAVCVETGEVEVMDLVGTSCADSSAAILRQLRVHHPEPLVVLWVNGPAQSGDALRTLLRLPAYSPDFNADAAIWDWVRNEVTANTCLGSAATVREHVGAFFRSLHTRPDEVKRRCRTALQARAEALATDRSAIGHPCHADSALALV
ncbi:MAG: winged helix-turn-helix domain-containing protein [Dehalococcoidia bacterium]